MKSIVYFILALLTIVYIGFLCYVNLYGLDNMSQIFYYISIYGGLGIALLYAAVNFFGNPLKIVFFMLLIIMVVLLILTMTIPDVFRKLFKISVEGKKMIEPFLYMFK